MPIVIEPLGAVILTSIIFAFLLVVTFFIITAIKNAIHNKKQKSVEKQKNPFKVLISSDKSQFDSLFIDISYFLVLEFFLMFLLLFSYTLKATSKPIDNWPVFVFLLIIFFSFLMINNWSGIKSKRTIQVDMKRF